MSTDSTDIRGRLRAAELAIGQDEPEVAFEALIEAAKEQGDSDQLIDAGHELKSHGMKIRDDGDRDE